MINSNRLKELRIQKNMTQEQVADALHVSKSSICCYENSLRNPSLEVTIAMMYLFNVSADYLLGLEHSIKTVGKEEKVAFMSEEEIIFIESLREDKTVYNILLDNPRRGAELVKKRVG